MHSLGLWMNMVPNVWVPKDAGSLPTKGQCIRFSRMYLLQRVTSTPWHTKPHINKLKQEMKVGWQKCAHSTVYSIHLCDTTGRCSPGPTISTVSQLCCILFGSTPWMRNSTVARPLPKNDKTNKTWHTWIHAETEIWTSNPALQWQKALQSYASPTALSVISVSALKRPIEVNEANHKKIHFNSNILNANLESLKICRRNIDKVRSVLRARHSSTLQNVSPDHRTTWPHTPQS